MVYMILVIVLMLSIFGLLRDITKNINTGANSFKEFEGSFEELKDSLKELEKSLDKAIKVAQAQSSDRVSK